MNPGASVCVRTAAHMQARSVLHLLPVVVDVSMTHDGPTPAVEPPRHGAVHLGERRHWAAVGAHRQHHGGAVIAADTRLQHRQLLLLNARWRAVMCTQSRFALWFAIRLAIWRRDAERHSPAHKRA